MPKFDLSQTQALVELFAVPGESRDPAWRRQFYAAVPDATLLSFEPQVAQGPDHFPYFELAIPDPGPVTPFCVTHLLDFVLDSGFGIAIFGDSSRSAGPQWVFTYGDLLSYSLYGDFDGDPNVIPADREPAGGERQVLVAAPSETYLPARARKALGTYVREMYQHPDPKIALIEDPHLKPSRNLMINLSLEQYGGDEGKLRAALHYLSWFLPGHTAWWPFRPAGPIPISSRSTIDNRS